VLILKGLGDFGYNEVVTGESGSVPDEVRGPAGERS